MGENEARRRKTSHQTSQGRRPNHFFDNPPRVGQHCQSRPILNRLVSLGWRKSSQKNRFSRVVYPYSPTARAPYRLWQCSHFGLQSWQMDPHIEPHATAN